jgi:hypothetical protein
MITKIGEKDRFRYDDANRPAVVQLASNVLVAGYNFCGRLKITGDAGFVDAHHLYADGKASFIIHNGIVPGSVEIGVAGVDG